MDKYANEVVYYNGKHIPFAECARYNGFKFTEKLLERQKTLFKNKKPKETAEWNVVDFKPKKNGHKERPIEDQFLPLEYENFFGNEMLMKTLGNKTMLFLILLKNKVDW